MLDPIDLMTEGDKLAECQARLDALPTEQRERANEIVWGRDADTINEYERVVDYAVRESVTD